MKMLKKLTAIVLSMLMILSIFPASLSVGAADTETADTGATYFESEPNDSKSTATPITLKNTYVGTFFDRDENDNDYFKVDLQGGKSYKFTLECPDSLLDQAWFDVFTPDGDRVVSLSDIFFKNPTIKEGNSRTIVRSMDVSGTYYIKWWYALDDNYETFYDGTQADYSITISESTLTQPDEVIPKQTKLYSDHIGISWYPSNNAQGYYVYREDSKYENSVRIATLDADTCYYNDYNVTLGSSYYYYVVAFNDYVLGEYSNSIYVNYTLHSTVPDAVTMNQIEYTDYGPLRITWTESAKASGYYVYRMGSNENGYKLVDTIDYATADSYYDNDVQEGVRYSYYVIPYNNVGNGPKSNMVSATYATIPDAVKLNDIQVVKGKHLSLSWSKSPNADGYRIYRMAKYEDIYKLIHTINNPSTLSYNDADVKDGYNYYYKVVAFNVAGEAEYNYVKSAVFEDYFDTPKITTLTNTSNGIKITWDKVSLADCYRVYVKTSSGWKGLGNTTSTSYTHTGLTSGTKYTYTVRCMADDGKTATSDYDKTGTTHRFLATPKVTKLENTSSGVKLTWGKVTGATKYRVYAKVSTGWKGIGDVTTTTFTHKKAESGKNYLYTVKAFDANDTCSSFVSAGFSTLFVATPKISSINNTGSGLVLKWNKITGATGYYVYRKPSGGSWTKIATFKTNSTLTYTDKKGKNGTSYYYCVKAYKGSTTSALSNTPLIVYLTKPKIGKLTSVSNGLKLTWTKSSSVSGYKIYRKTLPDGDYKLIKTVGVNTVSYTDTSVKQGVNYRYAIKTYKGSSLSGYSDVVNLSGVSCYTNIPLGIGFSKTITATGLKSKATYASSNTSIFTVNSAGKITGKKAGTAKLYVRGKGYSKTVNITVVKVGVSITTYKSTIAKGGSSTFKATTSPSGHKVTWKSSNTKVATVNSAGKVTGVSAGTATITATFKYSGKTFTASKKVTVQAAKPSYTVSFSKIATSLFEFKIVNNGSKTLRVYSADSYLNGVSMQIISVDSNGNYIFPKYMDVKPGYWARCIFTSASGRDVSFYNGSVFSFYMLYDGVKFKETLK
ncbi:MAG: Ig-like domain-containing protein [Ruminococcus sp.]|nr:Ig-like domain-containing protein [Ruminococcus sp.]